MHALAITTVLAFLAGTPSLAQERDVTDVVLRKYFEQTQAGAIAFPEQRRPLRLADRTIIPSTVNLKVSSFFRENVEPAKNYEAIRRTLLRDLIARSKRRRRIRTDVPHYRAVPTRRGSCGPEIVSDKRYCGAVALSRPGFSRTHDEAIVYLEYDGGGCAYFLKRSKGGWVVVWAVALWGCG